MFDWLSKFWEKSGRPDPNIWKVNGNCERGDAQFAFEEAARRIGVEIKIAYPVPCPIGAEIAARTGFVGIYIKRDHAHLSGDLQEMKWQVQKEMES